MGNTGSTRAGAKALASAAVAGDIDGAREIVSGNPAGWVNTFGVRNALVAAADQGNVNLLKLICENGGGQIRQSINAGASKGQAPLMRACMHGTPQHVECVAYLLVHGADVYVQTSRGDNVLHIAAKHGNAGCLHALLSSRPQADGEGGTVLLGDVLVQGDTGPTKLIDLHNGSGLTALHLAAIKGSVAVVRALVRAGAALDAPTLSGVLNPNLSRGSTALHIAAARGHAACVAALLESQAAIPGMELQRIRNARGLKASQLARLAGHHSVARLLSEAHIAPSHSAANSVADASRRPRRSAHARSDAQQPQPQPQPQPQAAAPPTPQRSRGSSSAPERLQVSQEAIIAAIVQRAKLLLSLRAVSLQGESGRNTSVNASNEEAALQVVAAEVSDALRSKGTGGHTESLSTLLGLLASLTDSTSPIAKEYLTVASGQSDSKTAAAGSPEDSVHGMSAAESALSGGNAAGQKRCEERQQKAAKAVAAGALMQAALNTMAAGAQGPQPLALLTPTSSAAAALAVQAALKKLSSSRHGARTLASAGLAERQSGPSASLHRQASNMSVRSAVSVASTGGSSSRSSRRHRRQVLRQTLSGPLVRHGSASEALSAMAAGHHGAAVSVSRRRRHSHRRSGSSGSASALILSPTAPREPAALSPSTAAGANQLADRALGAAAEHAAPGSSEAASGPASQQGRARGAPVDASGRDEPAYAVVGAASPASALPSKAEYGLSESSEQQTPPGVSPAQMALRHAEPGQLGYLNPFQHYLENINEQSTPEDASTGPAAEPSAIQTGASSSQANGGLFALQEASFSAPLAPGSPRAAAHGLSKSPFQHMPPLSPRRDSAVPSQSLPDHTQAGDAAGAARAGGPHSANMAHLRVRSRLFSISDDVPERVSPYRAAGSPTDPFESVELLGSDSLPSSPFGESQAGEALLHSSDNTLLLSSSGGEAGAHSSPDSLFARGRFMQTSDVAELLQTSCSGTGEAARHRQWGDQGFSEGQWRSARDSITESCDIEAILGDEIPSAALATLSMDHYAPWAAAAAKPRDHMPSVDEHLRTASPQMQPLLEDDLEEGDCAARPAGPPSPGSAAAQVAQVFGRGLSVAQGSRRGSNDNSCVGAPVRGVPEVPRPASVDPEEAAGLGSRQQSLAPPPGAAAAAVAAAFAKMSTAERAPQPRAAAAAQLGAAAAVPAGGQAGESSSRRTSSDAGQFGLQSEGSVPPTPGIAAAQVASAFARLRSRSNSPRDAEDHSDDAGRQSGQLSSSQNAASAPIAAGSPRACNVGHAVCGGHEIAPDEIAASHGAIFAFVEAGTPPNTVQASSSVQEPVEGSKKVGAGSSRRDSKAGMALLEGNFEAAAPAGKSESKMPSRHSGKGKERAGVSAKPWTEMCPICMDAGLELSVAGCGHSLCARCAYQLCARGLAAPVCPFCRGVIQQFEPMVASQPI